MFAVVVTYHPDREKLLRLLDSLTPQVARVVVIDNGSSPETLNWIAGYRSTTPLELIALRENRGIAAAQNAGIAHLRSLHAEYVILFDHDSVPAPDMVRRLWEAAEAKCAEGVAVAAMGPRYLDERQDNPPPFIRVEGIRVERQSCAAPDSVVEVSYLIASGCLIPMRVLDVVGDMKEDLFIDYVDIEWGLRARQKGFRSFGVCGATMGHDLGDQPIRFLNRKIPLHSPLRHYYHFRNAIWLYGQSELPLHWKIADGWRLLLKYGFYTLFARPRQRHWWMMTKGVCHGLAGRMGKYS
ncbi:glycosyltransferase family 2 protein [Azoarcus sp. PA01]|nr:glycosyltransferase family 2 protein [Azoarcus sp. PA01]